MTPPMPMRPAPCPHVCDDCADERAEPLDRNGCASSDGPRHNGRHRCFGHRRARSEAAIAAAAHALDDVRAGGPLRLGRL